MVDYYALISPTIEPLAAASPEERKLVYERLVAMLDQQLRAADPPRSDKDILKERIQMETAIRRVERHILAKRAPAPSKSDQPRQDWERAGSQSLDEAQRDSLSGETSALEPVIAEPVIAEPVIAEPVIAEPVVADPVIAEAPAPAVPEPFNEQTDENTSFEAPSLAESDHQDTVPGMPKISEPMLVKDDQEAEGFHDQPHEREIAQAPDAIDGEGPVAHAAQKDARAELFGGVDGEAGKRRSLDLAAGLLRDEPRAFRDELELFLGREQRRRDEEVRGGPVARDRDVPHHRDPQQRAHVRVVRLRLQRVPEKYQEVDPAFGYHGAYLKVASQRAALHLAYLQSKFLLY